MNPQKENGIGYCTHTWNPMTGCDRGCPYCYARMIVTNRIVHNPKLEKAFPNGFDPTLHPTRFDQPFKRKKPSRIFVCDMGDLFGDSVPDEWIQQICQAIAKADWHTYLFLTKNPKRYLDCVFSKNHWVGTTIEHEKYYMERSRPFWDSDLMEKNKWVSMEPLLSDMPVDSAFDWIVVGERSGIRHTDEQWNDIVSWAGDIIKQAKELEIPVFVKNKLADVFPQRELPKVVA